MRIDCSTCTGRGIACSDCVVTHLLGLPLPVDGDLEAGEARALAALHEAGLVPPLRLAPASEGARAVG